MYKSTVHKACATHEGYFLSGRGVGGEVAKWYDKKIEWQTEVV